MERIYEYRPKTPKLNEEFAEYLEGKTVAIVGRSGLHDLEQGEFIDSHDVVVRVHKMVPFNPSNETHQSNHVQWGNDPVESGEMIVDEWAPVIGKRVNIYYHRFRKSPKWWEQFMPIFRQAGGKFFCNDCSGGQNVWGDAYPQIFVPVRYVSWELTSQLRLELKGVPFSGTICIADILTHNVKSAYLTGFLCYFDTEIEQYKSLPRNEKSSLPDLRFLARMNKDDRVTVDFNMQFLFDKFCKDA